MSSLRSYLITAIITTTIGISAGVYVALHDSTPVSSEFFDTTVANDPISYIYAPGIFGTEMLMARYCPSFVASTGEKITCRSGGYVINEPHTAVVFPEIDLRKPDYFTLNPFTWISNSIRRDLYPLLSRLFQDAFDFTVEDNPDSKLSVVNYGFNMTKANGGQGKDIQALRTTIKRQSKQYPNHRFVLYGDSRGADTIFSYLAEDNPSDIAAAILEGMVDEIRHQIKHFLYHDKDPRTERRLHDLNAWLVWSYKKNGICPRQTVEKITDNVPLLLVISLKDGLVPAQGVFYMYKRLLERGHTKVHVLILQKAPHPCYMIHNDLDRTLYETVVHAFYKHYNLPHNSAKAAQGHQAFLATQPSLQELADYQLPLCEKC